jgi:hypothetical protein
MKILFCVKKKPQQDMAMRLLEDFRVFGKTDKDINLQAVT